MFVFGSAFGVGGLCNDNFIDVGDSVFCIGKCGIQFDVGGKDAGVFIKKRCSNVCHFESIGLIVGHGFCNLRFVIEMLYKLVALDIYFCKYF